MKLFIKNMHEYIEHNWLRRIKCMDEIDELIIQKIIVMIFN